MYIVFKKLVFRNVCLGGKIMKKIKRVNTIKLRIVVL